MLSFGLRCSAALLFVLALAGGLVASPASAARRTGKLTDLITTLPVRWKSDAPKTAANDPISLLSAFPAVVSQAGPTQQANPRVRSAEPQRFASLKFAGDPLPRRSEVLSSGFGMRRHPILGGIRMHAGVDLAAPLGTPVFATADGRVGAAGRRGGYGLEVTLEHAGRLETRYGHMSRLNVRRGQTVRQGEVIGWVGSTGLSTGPHLHYETRIRGAAVNPLLHMRRLRR